MRPPCAASQAQICSTQLTKLALDPEPSPWPAVSVRLTPCLILINSDRVQIQFQDAVNNTPTDSDIDIDNAELSYPEVNDFHYDFFSSN